MLIGAISFQLLPLELVRVMVHRIEKRKTGRETEKTRE